MKGITGIIVGVIGLAAAVLGIAEHKKCNDALNKLDTTVDEMSRNQQVDIEQAIVERAVNQAVERKSNAMVSTAIDNAREEVREDIRRKIRDAVDAEFERQKPDISGRLAAEAENIDMDELKKDVTSKAEAAILKKFYEMGGMPRIYTAFNGMLNGTQTAGFSIDKLSDILDQFAYDSDKKRVLELLLGHDNNRNDVPWYR